MKHRLGGRAKAMLVTSARLHAVRYKLAFDRYIAERTPAFAVPVSLDAYLLVLRVVYLAQQAIARAGTTASAARRGA